ncbi:hypothetical protein QP794_27050 [Paenibacillus sp. UMB7766-LJ446]|uniref:hypothetical protein n=1 Tax=Paenibacillus sp. UMB7766-LJ446 TaxID=3046313 RepID=UPI00254E21A8|nr:hypothetical protein [Paenibacillus sp. UMB7766-LJ446]MDK8193746.1 hypothetical protein [Paenibacillus sp. UMB7766-LJ446]
MGHYFYVTPDEYAEAAKLGINSTLLDRRIREQGWSKCRAMTTPPRKSVDRKHWRAEAEKNGVNYVAFMSRINRGWSMERAATEPLQTPEQAREQAIKATEAIRIYPKKYVDLAIQNGIAYVTFARRVKCMGWDFERAATEPLWSRQKAGKLGGKVFTRS